MSPYFSMSWADSPSRGLSSRDTSGIHIRGGRYVMQDSQKILYARSQQTVAADAGSDEEQRFLQQWKTESRRVNGIPVREQLERRRPVQRNPVDPWEEHKDAYQTSHKMMHQMKMNHLWSFSDPESNRASAEQFVEQRYGGICRSVWDVGAITEAGWQQKGRGVCMNMSVTAPCGLRPWAS